MPLPEPMKLVGLLRTASRGTSDPALEVALAEFASRWRSIGRARYRALGPTLDDVIQDTLATLVTPEKLDQLTEPSGVRQWANRIFINKARDALRERRRMLGRREYLGSAEDDPEDALRGAWPSPGPSPEELAALRERLSIVRDAVDASEIARLKFREDLPDQEIADRMGITGDAVRSWLKRFRKSLKEE